MATGDIGLVERAMSNLIDNAIKYTPKGGSVKVSAHWDGAQVQIDVSDTGIGISEEDIPHIFDRFYIADKSRHDSADGSTGLGLAIAKKIVELHNSVLSVHSRMNAGTTFSFSLPSV
jgi:signal transduction histidine kinase